jgi:hypothetical protein
MDRIVGVDRGTFGLVVPSDARDRIPARIRTRRMFMFDMSTFDMFTFDMFRRGHGE